MKIMNNCKKAGVLIAVLLILFSTISVSANIITNPEQKDDRTTSQYTIELGQIDFYLDGGTIENSSWGIATIGYPSDTLMYFNLAIAEQWIIENLPIMPIGNEFIVNFDLLVANGEDVTALYYACNLTENPLVVIPTNYELEDTVIAYPVILNSGEIGEILEYVPIGLLVGCPGNIVDSAWHDSQYIHNQPQGINECVPGAISNSLKFLNDRHNLGMNNADISIAKMKLATGWTPSGAPATEPNAWWNLKKSYMENNSYPIDTTIYKPPFNLKHIMNEIRRGQDVEMRIPGHAVMVVGITECDNGKFIFGIAHDIKQGIPGGEIIEYPVYNPSTGRFESGTGVGTSSISRFVVECPKDGEECCLVIKSMTGGLFAPTASLKIEAVIENIGTADCTDVTWQFTTSGGIVLWGTKGDTEPSLLPGATLTVKSRIFIGLAIPGIFPGEVTITANATNNACLPATKTKQLFLLVFLLDLV
jgi:hypothetical protein